MIAEIISVGTELLLGNIVNSNAQYLAGRLAELGFDLYYQTVVGDNTERLKAALDVFSPYLDEKGHVVPYWHHETWHDDNGSSHIKAALLSPFITVPFVDGKITVGPWQNLILVECDTRNRVRDIVFQVMGE